MNKKKIIEKIDEYLQKLEKINSIPDFEKKHFNFYIFRDVVEKFMEKELNYKSNTIVGAISLTRNPELLQQMDYENLLNDINTLHKELITERQKLIEFGKPKRNKDYPFLQKSIKLNLKIIEFDISIRDSIYLILGIGIGILIKFFV